MVIFTDSKRNYRVYRPTDGYPEILSGGTYGIIWDLAEIRDTLLSRRKVNDFLESVVEEWIDLYGHQDEGTTHQFGYCQCDTLLSEPLWIDTDHYAEYRYTVDVSNPASWTVKCEELHPWVVIRGKRAKEVLLRGVLKQRNYRFGN